MYWRSECNARQEKTLCVGCIDESERIKQKKRVTIIIKKNRKKKKKMGTQRDKKKAIRTKARRWARVELLVDERIALADPTEELESVRTPAAHE